MDVNQGCPLPLLVSEEYSQPVADPEVLAVLIEHHPNIELPAIYRDILSPLQQVNTMLQYG